MIDSTYQISQALANYFISRPGISSTACILCGKEKQVDEDKDLLPDICKCPTSIGCQACEDDIIRQIRDKQFAVHYTCQYHGKLRHYEDGLMRYKV